MGTAIVVEEFCYLSALKGSQKLIACHDPPILHAA